MRNKEIKVKGIKKFAVRIARGTLLFSGILLFAVPSLYADDMTDMNQRVKDVLARPSGTIRIEIDNSLTFFSPKKYYFTLMSAQDKLVRNKSDEVKKEFELEYEQKMLHERRTKLVKYADVKELDFMIYRERHQGWWFTNEDASLLVGFTYPNKNYSHLIFDKSTGAALIDLKEKKVVHYFVHGQNFVWNEIGDCFVYDATRNYLNFPNIPRLDFAIYDVSQNKEILRREIPKKSAKDVELLSNFAWSPDSKFIALLRLRIVDVSWTRILGHGTATLEYDLSIYDLSGELVYAKQIEGKYQGTFYSRMIWE